MMLEGATCINTFGHCCCFGEETRTVLHKSSAKRLSQRLYSTHT